MTKIRAIAGMPQVALLLETSTEFGRGLIRGIVRYSRLHGPWALYVAPGHLEQSLPKANSWSGSGIIARMRSAEMAKQIRATGLPFVASSLDEFRLPRRGDKFGEIRTNSAAIARMAATHLTERSLRNFAFCGFHGCAWSSCREEVFSRFLTDHGFECHTHRIELGNWMHLPNWIEDWEHEQRILLDWLKSLPRPVGLMACNDICGRAVLQACAAAQLRVPDDVAVVGVDNDELMCELSNPPLSSIALDVEKSGYDAARLLDSLMSGHREGDHVVQVEPVYVETRQSSDVIALDDPSVASALRFIKDHAGQPIDVSHVVEYARVSRRTLERRFARVLGRSISAAITQFRLERAKRLLLETDLPSGRVAHGAGFGTIKTFNRVFRRAAGVAPQGFRQSAAASQHGRLVRRPGGSESLSEATPASRSALPRGTAL